MKKISKVQKGLLLGSLVSLGIIIVLLILAIFGVSNKVTWKIVLCALYILAGCVFGVNALTFSDKNKILSIACLALVSISVLGALILTWMKDAPKVSIQLEGTFAILTAFLVILIGTTLKSFGRFKAIQLALYIISIMIDIVLTIQVWGGTLFQINMFTQFFVGFVVVDVGLLITISILNKKTIDDDNKVSITKEEYNALKEKAALYDKLMEEKNNE